MSEGPRMRPEGSAAPACAGAANQTNEAPRSFRSTGRRGTLVPAGALAQRPLCAEQTVALELAIQRRGPDPELFGGLRLVPSVQVQRPDDVLLLDLVERSHRAADRDRLHGGLADLLWQILELDAAAARQRNGALHGLLQLAHVAGPAVAHELIGRARGQARDLALHPQGSLRQQHPAERQEIVGALAQRRNVQLDDLQAV